METEFELPEIAIGAGQEIGRTTVDVIVAQLMSDPHLGTSIFRLNKTTQLVRKAPSTHSTSSLARLVALWLEMGQAAEADPVDVACVKFEGLSALLGESSNEGGRGNGNKDESVDESIVGLWMSSSLDMMAKMRGSLATVRLDLIAHCLHGICLVSWSS